MSCGAFPWCVTMQLTREVVANIPFFRGSFLGVSRGGSDTKDIVDSIEVRIAGGGKWVLRYAPSGGQRTSWIALR